jgi:hypothetical protein
MDQGDTDWPVLLATDLDHYFKELVLTYQHRLYGFALRQTVRRMPRTSFRRH